MPRANPWDYTDWRQSQANGRERGCWVYIPAEVLRASWDKGDVRKPLYRAVSWGKRTVLIRLAEPQTPQPESG